MAFISEIPVPPRPADWVEPVKVAAPAVGAAPVGAGPLARGQEELERCSCGRVNCFKSTWVSLAKSQGIDGMWHKPARWGPCRPPNDSHGP